MAAAGGGIWVLGTGGGEAVDSAVCGGTLVAAVGTPGVGPGVSCGGGLDERVLASLCILEAQ